MDRRRELLGFEDEVKLRFEYLCSEFNYNCVESQPTLVRYESSVSYINIYHGRQSYEIDLEFGQHSSSAEFRLSEVISALPDLIIDIPIPFQSNSKDSIAKGIAAVSQIVKDRFALLLLAKAGEFERLNSAVERYRDADTCKIVDLPIREKAEVAWKETALYG